MKITRIYVHKFRGLKNVELSFNCSPKSPLGISIFRSNISIFPITGENGSGKSTLLQLIFLLLNSPGYITNALPTGLLEQDFPLADIDIMDGKGRILTLSFLLVRTNSGVWLLTVNCLNASPDLLQIALERLKKTIYLIVPADERIIFLGEHHQKRFYRYNEIYQLAVAELIPNIPNLSTFEGLIKLYLDGLNYPLEPDAITPSKLRLMALQDFIERTPDHAIFLIDGIENGLHPDKQYALARDLSDWGDHQYLLATHSHNLCNALSPSNVKTL